MWGYWRFFKSSPSQTPEERAMIDQYLREHGALRLPPAWAFGSDSLITKTKLIDSMFSALRAGSGRSRSNSKKDAAAAYGVKLVGDFVEEHNWKREA